MSRTVARWALTVVGLGLLVWLLIQVDWSGFTRALSNQRALSYVPVLVGLLVLEAMLDGLALCYAIGGRVPLIEVVAANQVGSIANRLFPLDSGELLKMSLLKRLVGAQRSIAGTVIWNIQFKLTRPLLVLGLSCLAWWLGGPWPPGVRWTVTGAAIAILPYVGLHLLLRLPVARQTVRLLGRLRLLKRAASLENRANDMQRRIRNFASDDPTGLLGVRAAQLGARLVSLFIWVVALRAVGANYDWPTAVIAWAAVNVVAYVSSIIPTRLGTVEASAFGAFALVGLDPEVGLVAQLLLTVLGLAVAVALGLPSKAAWAAERSVTSRTPPHPRGQSTPPASSPPS